MQVCRTSGRLATDACHRAGDHATYSEYFARGTEPADVCLLHRFDRLGVVVASAPDMLPAAPVAAVADSAAQAAQPATQIVLATEPQEPKKKKRGFWGRLFGKDDKNDKRR